MMLEINSKLGLLQSVTYLPSPHCDERPAGVVIDTVVIHNISLPPGQFGTDCVEKFFCGHLDTSIHPSLASIEGVRVSAHLFIKRTGEIIQFVPFTKRAWHAGVSSLYGRERCNDFSIGIELEGTDTLPFEDAQYQQLAQVMMLLMQTYPAIKHNHIVGHSDIAPGRKTDPGEAFDWTYLRGMLA